jgi:proteasome lid subunit RPN8/RPN11
MFEFFAKPPPVRFIPLENPRTRIHGQPPPLPAGALVDRSAELRDSDGIGRPGSHDDVFLYRSSSEPQPLTFALTPRAAAAIDAIEANENHSRVYDRFEVGGFLLAHRESPMRIEAAVPAYRDAAPSSVSLSVTYADTRAYRDLVVVGDWHTHPAASDGTPSKLDLRGAAAMLRLLQDAPVFLSVIGTPREFGGQLLHGWATRRRACGGFKCEPVRLINLAEAL